MGKTWKGFLGVLFDSRLTWADHIRKNAKKVINVIRCVTGREWGVLLDLKRMQLMANYWANL